MGILDALPTLADRSGGPQPKGKLRLDEAEDARKADERGLALWRRGVKARDGKVCRCCLKRVVETLALQANRAECHHLTGRAHKPTRHDVRNGLLTCLRCHRRIERSEIQIVGTQQFTIGNRSYVNADFPITVKELAA